MTMDNEFSVGKLKIGLMKASDSKVAIEYDFEGETYIDTLSVSDFRAFLKAIYEALKGYKVEGLKKKNPETFFDRKTVENLRRIGINDFSYISRDMD